MPQGDAAIVGLGDNLKPARPAQTLPTLFHTTGDPLRSRTRSRLLAMRRIAGGLEDLGRELSHIGLGPSE